MFDAHTRGHYTQKAVSFAPKSLDSNVKKFGYNEQPPTTSSFLCKSILQAIVIEEPTLLFNQHQLINAESVFLLKIPPPPQSTNSVCVKSNIRQKMFYHLSIVEVRSLFHGIFVRGQASSFFFRVQSVKQNYPYL